MLDSDYPLPRDFRLTLADLHRVAVGVKRPECVLAMSDGTVICSHADGGYSRIRDGVIKNIVKSSDDNRTFLPNGIAVGLNGEVLFAHLGVEDGGIYSINSSGVVSSVIESVDDRPLPPTNYVSVTDEGAIWLTVSTRKIPRSLAWNKLVSDGFIAYHDAKGTRIVADGLGYTNEIGFSPDGKWLYANETYAQRLVRFRLGGDGQLCEKEVVAQLGGADLPDGLTFDDAGGVWLTCIASNRVLVVRPDGDVQVILDEPDLAHSKKIESGIRQGTLTWSDMQGPPGLAPLGNTSSLAFGGAERKKGFIGSLTSDCLWAFESPIVGAAPSHFNRKIL